VSNALFWNDPHNSNKKWSVLSNVLYVWDHCYNHIEPRSLSITNVWKIYKLKNTYIYVCVVITCWQLYGLNQFLVVFELNQTKIFGIRCWILIPQMENIVRRRYSMNDEKVELVNSCNREKKRNDKCCVWEHLN